MSESTLGKHALPYSERGSICHPPQSYGRSVAGIPLEYWPSRTGKTEILLIAGMHGEEPETTVLLSRAMRTFKEPSANCSVVLTANPDGLLRGTRGNINNVDLNRNFPTLNWTAGQMPIRWFREGEPRVVFTSGSSPGSEPETAALISLVEKLEPEYVINLHAPLAWIDDPNTAGLGRWLSQRTGMKLVEGPGYPTPGSFGTWCLEHDIREVTYELPSQCVWELLDPHLAVLQELLLKGKEAWPE